MSVSAPVGATAPATTPPVSTPPVTAPPVSTPPSVSPPSPPPATPPVTTPPVASPPSPPPATPPPAASPPASTPPPTTTPPASPPPVASPPPPPPATPPSSTPPPVASPPAPPPATPPPAASPPAATPPPTTTPPTSPPPGSSPPPPSPPPPPSSPSPPPSSPSPPPPSNVPPPPPGAPVSSPPPPPPPASPPPPSPIAPPLTSSPPPPARSSTHAPPPPPHSNGTALSSGGGSSGIGTTAIVGIAVGGVVAVVLIAVIWLCLARKKPDPKLNLAAGPRVTHSSAPGGAGLIGGSATSLSSYGTKTEYLDSGEIKPPPPFPGMSEIMGAAAVGGVAAANGGRKPVPPPPMGNGSAGSTRPWFTYEELEVATNGFSPANLLGEGGFGRVYEGVIAGNQQVAVKQLTIGGGQGEREFRAEVEIISRVHHRHLVSLVGYCIADSQRLLVYDYVPNGTLEHALHGVGQPTMDWGTRMKIALGAARGLAYLHEDCHPRIIHRDIKASNILLDNQWEAQVADFGLAKLANDTYTHVTTRVMGTFGYLAPEYALSGKLTDKSDVYSFGVVLLELITGKKPVDVSAAAGEESLVEWARPALTQAIESGNVDALADPNLLDMYNEKEMFRMVEAAAACVRHSSQKRPKMAMVVRALETEGADLNQGVKPGHSTVYGGFDSVTSSEFDSSQYKANLKKFRQVAYGNSASQYSSDYSAGTTSDYGAAQSASSSEFGSSSREHPTVVPPVRGPNAPDSNSSGERSGDEVRLDIGGEPSPRGGYSSGSGVGLSKMGPATGTLPLPPNRRPVGSGLSVRSPRGGESVRSRSPAQKGGQLHQRKGSETGGNETGMMNRLGSFASTVFSRDSTPQPPPPPPDYVQQLSGEFPESKYSTEDEGTKKAAKANRLEEGSRPLLSAHKTKTVKFDFDG
ncbi:unnamed protein product [Calypogeia fissa]